MSCEARSQSVEHSHDGSHHFAVDGEGYVDESALDQGRPVLVSHRMTQFDARAYRHFGRHAQQTIQHVGGILRVCPGKKIQALLVLGRNFDRGFKLEHIRASVAAPLMLPAFRVLGDDGDFVSAREVCKSTGVELELLQRLQRAVGLPCIEDPDAAGEQQTCPG